MEGRETPRMHKYEEIKRLELWWQLYVTWLPERDLDNFELLDFCWTEGTKNYALPELEAARLTSEEC